MSANPFPGLIKSLNAFEGPIDAYQLNADRCKTLFASYNAGLKVDDHTHDTENVGVVIQGELFLTKDGVEEKYATGNWYHIDANQIHSARFEIDSAAIEFWFERS